MYIFFDPIPGVGLGALAAGMYHIEESVFLSAAEALAKLVTESDFEVGRMYPPWSSLKDCSIKIAIHVAEEAFENGTASTYPKPEDMKTFIENQLYNYEYDNVVSIPPRYKWNI